MLYQGTIPSKLTASERDQISLDVFRRVLSVEPEFADIEPRTFARLQVNCLTPIRHHLIELSLFDDHELYRYAVERIKLEYEFLKSEHGYR